MSINKTLSCFLSMLASAAVLAADNSAEVIMDAGPCLEIVSPIERLACFEEQANAAQARGSSNPQQNQPVVSIPRSSRQQTPQSPPQDQPQLTSETPQEAAQEVVQEVESTSMPQADSVESNFGLPEEKINEGKEKVPENELIARVANIKELGLNRYLVTLENGQVWEQMQTRRFALAEGDEVRIYPTRWGSSFRLSSQSHKGFIQVERLR